MSLFYGYQQLRRQAKRPYTFSFRPELSHPTSITDTISLEKFQQVRVDNDHEASHGYSYAVLGNDDVVDQWVNHGIETELLGGFWRLELDSLIKMDRSQANQRLMQWLRDDQM